MLVLPLPGCGCSGTTGQLIPRADALAPMAATVPLDKEVESASSPCRGDIPEYYHQIKSRSSELTEIHL